MPRADYAHKMTDKQLAELESRISKLYKQAADELSETVTAYFKQFEKRDAEMQDKVKAGTITEQEYKQWRLAQIGRGKRYEALRDKVAERYTNANETAIAYVNDTTPGVYTLNRNYAAYAIEQVSDSADFTLWDEQTVKRLAVEQPDLMPYYPKDRALKRGIDLAYGKQQITASVTSGILQGKSVYKIADYLQASIAGMCIASARRTARTAVTGAQNAGRMAGLKAAIEMGIPAKKRWIATLDNRTRHAHQLLDLQIADYDEPFKVDGDEIMYPGDRSAPAYLVYNCRCTMGYIIDGIDTSDGMRRAIDPKTGKNVLVPFEPYTEWANKKKAKDADALNAFMGKGKNAYSDKKQFAKYREILGNKAPNTIYKFQELKYNNPVKWNELKTLKRQTVFVNGAACETTPKKFTGYFLKDGAKHASEFFDVGYSKDNPMQLRYDIAKQFNESKAVEHMKDSDGKEKFSVFMNLGVNEKKRFRTVWLKESENAKPRIITAHRED